VTLNELDGGRRLVGHDALGSDELGLRQAEVGGEPPDSAGGGGTSHVADLRILPGRDRTLPALQGRPLASWLAWAETSAMAGRTASHPVRELQNRML
jgi:hypothetical protein